MNIPISSNAKPHFLDKKTSYYAPSNSTHFFPFGVYFLKKYGTGFSSIEFGESVSIDIVDFLEKNGEIIHESLTIPPDSPTASGVYDVSSCWDDSNAHQVKIFFYNDSLIHLERTPSRKMKIDKTNFKINLFYSPACVPPIENLKPFFIKEDSKNVIFTIMRDEHGSIRFEPFEVNVPESYSIEKCYNDDFVPIHQKIIKLLNKNESGLYLFHGDPGTGKTTYIKHLSSLIKRDIIYVPTSFTEYLADPSFLPALLHKKHSVLVIEDAEKALLARDPSDTSSVVSTILNITDGIMANVFNISIIATYNSPRQSIDKALLRKGRLKAEYHFEKLHKDKAQKIAKEINCNLQINESTCLADLYNTEDDSVISTVELFEEKRMGFR
jgi:hypothetical protein